MMDDSAMGMGSADTAFMKTYQGDANTRGSMPARMRSQAQKKPLPKKRPSSALADYKRQS